MPELSVLIPTFGRPEKVHACLRSLAEQNTERAFEVIVAVDGGTERPGEVSVPETLRAHTRVLELEKVGYIAARAIMLEHAEAPVFLSLNDDVRAETGLINAHLALHDRGENVVVGGAADWIPIDEPTLFDRLVCETDLIFFTPPAEAVSDPVPTGFRSIFGLNFSAPTELTREVGGFPALPDIYGYDDIELAHRLQKQGGSRLLFHPGARVTHDHRFEPDDLIRRERKLGIAAWHYAKLNPRFGLDVFGRDITAKDELAYAKQAIERESRDAERIAEHFRGLARLGPDAASEALLPTLSTQWVLLKRRAWRLGLLEAAGELGTSDHRAETETRKPGAVTVAPAGTRKPAY